jgi:hypothetical protein
LPALARGGCCGWELTRRSGSSWVVPAVSWHVVVGDVDQPGI